MTVNRAVFDETKNNAPKFPHLQQSIKSELPIKYDTMVVESDSNGVHSYDTNITTPRAKEGLTYNNADKASTTKLVDKAGSSFAIPTHGYVHGHIHKHKDHTHIHGHIHNHDHDLNQLNPCDYQLDCNDIFCDDLDNTNSTNDTSTDNCNYFIDCNDQIYQQDLCCEDPLPDVYCQPSSNKLIFNDVINNVNQNINYKKQKISQDFQIHFPHDCHPNEYDNNAINDNDSKKSNDNDKNDNDNANNHHFHQLCFHATIPNENETDSGKVTDITSNSFPSQTPLPPPVQPTSEQSNKQLLSDYDFFVQFNNFNQLINQNHSLELIPTDNFSCQWDNCFKRINDSNFIDHLVQDHINQEFIEPSKTYHCEWKNCNFHNDNLKGLLSHINNHKLGLDKVEDILNQKNPAFPILQSSLTPNSNSPESVNITQMKIMPKKKCTVGVLDENYTCKWQVGKDSDGNPIPCNHTHKSPGDLQNHLINDHIGSGKSLYNCQWICCERHNGKVFTQRQKLLRHIHIHTNYKPCKCELCGATFAVDSMLKQHLRTHSGEKPFECQICHKKFATSSSLSIHNRVHTGEKPLVCKYPNCGKRFSESSNLTKHMKIHMKSFTCEICGEEFDKKPNYTKHLKLHKDDQLNNPLQAHPNHVKVEL